MFGKSACIVLIASCVSILFASCTGDSVGPPGDRRTAAIDDPAWLEDELGRSAELRELFSIRDEIAARAVARNLTAADVRAALGDARVANELLGLTTEEAESRFERIGALIGSLEEKYPVLAQGAADAAAGCGECGVDRIVEDWDDCSRAIAAALGEGASGTAGAPARPKLACKMTQLVVGMGLCAARSGGNVLFYTICAYGVFCGSCTGGMADVICFH